MDLREKKTLRSIRNAFLILRKGKPLEKISVKELAELAEISKGTFYLHYKDIFDLSESLQNEVIYSILESITLQERFLQDQAAFTEELCQAFYQQHELIDILFSGSQAGILPLRIEAELRNYLKNVYPESDARKDMLLTYQIQGGYFVYQQHHSVYSMDEIVKFVGELANATSALSRQ